MTRQEALSLIRDTLGCRCPEDALYVISRETRDNPDICWHLAKKLAPVLEKSSRIIMTVGGRLLVVVCQELESEETVIVLNDAVHLRDVLGFKRARIAADAIVCGTSGEAVTPRMPDDRVHLHFLNPGD